MSIFKTLRAVNMLMRLKAYCNYFLHCFVDFWTSELACKRGASRTASSNSVTRRKTSSKVEGRRRYGTERITSTSSATQAPSSSSFRKGQSVLIKRDRLQNCKFKNGIEVSLLVFIF